MTGTWLTLSNVRGGQVRGNFFRNGALAIICNNAKGVSLDGNTFYALENTPPVLLGTSNIVPGTNYVTTDSGANVPALT